MDEFLSLEDIQMFLILMIELFKVATSENFYFFLSGSLESLVFRKKVPGIQIKDKNNFYLLLIQNLFIYD